MIAKQGWGIQVYKTYSRRLIWRGRLGRRRRRRRACTRRSWTFVVGRSHIRTRLVPTSDVLGTSLIQLMASLSSSWRRPRAASWLHPDVLAGVSTLFRTWWPVGVLDWNLRYACSLWWQQMEVCKVFSVAVMSSEYRSAYLFCRQYLQPDTID